MVAAMWGQLARVAPQSTQPLSTFLPLDRCQSSPTQGETTFTGGAFILGLLVLLGLWLWGTGLGGTPVEPNRPMLVHEHPQKAHITRASLQTAASGLGMSSLAPILPWRTDLCPTVSSALVCWGALCRHYGPLNRLGHLEGRKSGYRQQGQES